MPLAETECPRNSLALLQGQDPELVGEGTAVAHWMTEKSLWCHTCVTCWEFFLQSLPEIRFLRCWGKLFIHRGCFTGNTSLQNRMNEGANEYYWVLLASVHYRSRRHAAAAKLPN